MGGGKRGRRQIAQHFGERRELEGGSFVGVPVYESPQQLLDFSYVPRINEALEDREEVDRAWQDLEQMSHSEGEEPTGMESDDSRSSSMEVDDPTG